MALKQSEELQVSKLLVNPILPLFIAVLVTALVQVNRVETLLWRDYLGFLAQTMLEVSPVFLCKYLSATSLGWRKSVWWFTGFCLLPIVAVIGNNNVDFAQWLISNELTLVSLWIIEIAAGFNYWQNRKSNQQRKLTLTLDKLLLMVLFGFSFFWALLFNSIDDPLNNQPIPVLVDIKRNLLNIPMFLYYFLQVSLQYFLLFLVYWVNHHILVKRVLTQYGVYTYLWVTVLLLLFFYPILTQVALWLPLNDVTNTLTPSGDRNPFGYWNIYFGTLIVVISMPFVSAFQLQTNHRKLAELQQEKLATELKWLQQQINPHFLFNTLNNLYALCLTKSDKAPELILQLANLLRFVVYKGSAERVTLQEELTYLTDYIELQRLRVENKCRFDIQLDCQSADLMVSPLLFVIFIENAFKHGIEPTDQKSWLKVDITTHNNKIIFKCSNSIPKQNSTTENGIGLANVRRRLTLLYPNQHDLIVTADDSSFNVTLTLELA